MFLFTVHPVAKQMVAALVLGGSVLGLTGCDGGGSSADPPSPPSNVEATAQDGAVALTWDGGASTSEYNVYRATSPGVGTSGAPVNGNDPIGPSEFTDDSVKNGTLYYYRVTAVGEGGESNPSAEVSVRPFPSPPPRPES
ncbi:fibronectin type III domain-containing protein [Salinibacter altiplanensis]|uniref:fibronectin type III domain-containing protein n=1 Tax=Salinibacter altiplanensis TaxID=1803181 RepID=UPI000C9EFEF1|nr:fibronectin type III domain-containing protein [Salinibacter altiplanensis]